MDVRLGVLERVLVCAVGACLLALVAPARAAAVAVELKVDRNAAACSDARPRTAVSAETPWCTLAPAVAAALPGDVVSVRTGTYPEAFRPGSGVRYVAEGTVTLTATVKVVGASDVELDGFTVAGAPTQGIWLDGSSDVTLTNLTLTGNTGPGIAVKASRSTTVSASTISGNGGAGIVEYSTSSGSAIIGNVVSDNGRDGNPYNGDGIQLGGSGGVVARNTIERNGDAGPYEHGIYAGATASGYVIEQNTLADNAASDVKAAGDGVVRYNLMRDALFGLVISDNEQGVVVYENVIAGVFQHAVLVTTGKTPARAILWHNTIVQTGRSTSSGNASTVFVVSAASLELRNNVLCYTGADDLGIALWINSAVLASRLVSDTNWLCSRDPLGRVFAWNGSRTTATQWATSSGQDGRSVVSTPPLFDHGFRVIAPNRGARRGQSLGLTQDFAGRALPAVSPDIGAYQSVFPRGF